MAATEPTDLVALQPSVETAVLVATPVMPEHPAPSL
jgi:hypothetical protein